MDVNAAFRWKVQDGWFKNLSVGEDDDEVWLEVGKLGECGFGVNGIGLEDAELVLEGCLFNGGWGEFLFTSDGTVGLGDDADEFDVIVFYE